MTRYANPIAVLAALSTAAQAASVWREHPELPAWLSRGGLTWAINYTEMGPKDIDYMMDIGEQLIQGGAFGPGADERLRDGGARRMQYICSRTIYWRRLFESHPQLQNATIRTPSGEHLVIYNNPERYAGCYNKREWLDYILSQVDELAAAGNDAIFFDNPMVWPCYCETCRTKFRAFAREKIGREIDIPLPGEDKDKQAAEAAKLFRLETAERFFREIHEHARRKKPPVFITANNLCYWLVSRGVTDMVFTEAFAHPPFGRQIAPGKVGLAASGGKPTGVLAYPPSNVRAARGKRVWHEPGKHYLFVTPPLPLEYALGAAEGLACGNNYICNYGVTIGGSVTRADAADREAIARALKPYRRFQRRYAQYFTDSRPGSRIGYVFDWNEELRGGSILGRDLGAFDGAVGGFMSAGLPVDVVTERSLEQNELSDFDVLVFDRLGVLSRAAARNVGRFVTSGGGLVIAGGSPKVRDLLEAPDKAGPLNQFLGGIALPAGSYPSGEGRVVSLANPIPSTDPKPLTEALDLASRGRLPYRVNDPPPGLLLNVLDAPGAKATVLHLVNYRFEYGDGFSDPKVVPAKDVVLCARMTGEPPRVHLLTADAEPRVLALEKRADAWLVRVPEVGIYGAVVVGGD